MLKKKNRALRKVNKAYEEFKEKMLALDSKDIYKNAYKIYIMNEILMTLESEYEFSEKVIKNILGFKGNILEQIYQEWIDSSYIDETMISEIITDAVCSVM